MPNIERKKQLEDAVRILICNKYDSGKTIKTISLEFDINYKTIANIIHIYKKTGRKTKKLVREKRTKKINDEIIVLIKGLIHEDCSITLKKIQMKLIEIKNLSVSLATIDRVISGFQYTFKKVSLIPGLRNTIQNIQKRFEYANFYILQNEEKIVFVDEMGVNCSMRLTHGRSLIGTSPRKQVRSIRSKNFSVGSAISKKNMFCFKVYDSAFNGDKFEVLIRNLILCLREKDISNVIFVMDNCSIHKVQNVIKTIENSGHFLKFLPPYSPQLNPIEEAFSKWKTIIKSRNCNDAEELNLAITSAHLEISSSDCQNYFMNMRKFVLKAIQREEF